MSDWGGWGPCLEGELIGDGRRGCGCGPGTVAKQERNRGTLPPYIAVMRKHAGRFPAQVPQVLYLDLTAGPARYRDTTGIEYTSTGLAAHEAFARAGLRTVSLNFERVPPFAEHLKETLDNRPRPDLLAPLVFPGDAWKGVDAVLEMAREMFKWERGCFPFGFVSLDPNGEPDLERLAGLVRRHRDLLDFVDLWVHLPATIMKLVRRVHGRGLLEDRLRAIPKRYWKVRAPEGPLGWMELVGTNWPEAPTWRAAGFVDLDSPEGLAVLEGATFTEAERRARGSARQLGLALP